MNERVRGYEQSSCPKIGRYHCCGARLCSVPGAVTTNMVSGDLAVLDDFLARGLTESLIGYAKYFRVYGTNPMVHRCLR